MSMEQQAGELVVRLSDLKAEYESHYRYAQEILREYVGTTHYPITDRFEVWSKWCEKEDYRWKIEEADVPFFGKIVDDKNDCFFRYKEYNWLYFLKMFGEAAMRKRYTVTTDDVKELLIKHNFGSFRMAW